MRISKFEADMLRVGWRHELSAHNLKLWVVRMYGPDFLGGWLDHNGILIEDLGL